MKIKPYTLRASNEYVRKHHRHSKVVVGCKFCIAAVDEEVKMLSCKKESKRGCNNKSSKCITHNLWDQLDQHINNFFEKVKLQDLVKKNQNFSK